MWSHENAAAFRRVIRAGAALALAAAAAGCFQPLYGERSFSSNGAPGLKTALAGVQIVQINAPPGTAQARLAVEVRNELNYALTGGGSALPPTHRLNVTLAANTSSLIVDPTTARAEFEIVSVDATYQLIDVRTTKPVMDGAATARSSYDVPGQQQRFTRLRGERDSQSQAAKVIAEQIRNRLASWFAAGS